MIEFKGSVDLNVAEDIINTAKSVLSGEGKSLMPALKKVGEEMLAYVSEDVSLALRRKTPADVLVPTSGMERIKAGGMKAVKTATELVLTSMGVVQLDESSLKQSLRMGGLDNIFEVGELKVIVGTKHPGAQAINPEKPSPFIRKRGQIDALAKKTLESLDKVMVKIYRASPKGKLMMPLVSRLNKLSDVIGEQVRRIVRESIERERR